MADIDLTIESQATAPVEMEVSAGQVIPAPVDDTLTIRGMAADAKAAGDLIRQNTAFCRGCDLLVFSGLFLPEYDKRQMTNFIR